jgi:ribonucleoside-diphosphate reductase alpha chain
MFRPCVVANGGSATAGPGLGVSDCPCFWASEAARSRVRQGKPGHSGCVECLVSRPGSALRLPSATCLGRTPSPSGEAGITPGASAGDPPPRRLLAPLGRDARLLRHAARTRRRSTTSWLHARAPDGAPNSPQWFNTGLNWAYGINGPAQGHCYADPKTGRAQARRGRVHAPAAARVLHPERRRRPGGRGRHHGPVDPRGAAVQVRLGHGDQLLEHPAAPNEPLSGGGKSSGLMSWLKIGDRAARRDQVRRHDPAGGQDGLPRHGPPGHRDFVNWKVREEIKVAALVEGSRPSQGDAAGRARSASTPRDDRRDGRALGLQRSTTTSTASRTARPSRARTPTTRCASPTRSSTRSTRDERLGDHFRTDGEVAKKSPTRELWDDIATPRGGAPTRACSSTRRSTRGTPAPSAAGSTRATRAASTCSSTTRRATWRRSTSEVLRPDETPLASSTSRRFEHASTHLDDRARDLVLMAAFPSEEIAELSSSTARWGSATPTSARC